MKKIDTSKSVIFGDKIEDLKKSFEYLNGEGFFSNYKDFSDYKEGILKMIKVSDDSGYPYVNKYNTNSFDYFIPKDMVVFESEELAKKYRPYVNSDELPFAVGDIVVYRCKDCCSECKGMVTEIEFQQKYPYEIDNIIIGGIDVTPQELFDHYERLDDYCQYKPFGVEE